MTEERKDRLRMLKIIRAITKAMIDNLKMASEMKKQVRYERLHKDGN